MQFNSLDLIEQIKNDLEVLEILKSSIFNTEEHVRAMSEPKGDKFLLVNISVKGDDNIKKIKEWLDDK